MKGLSNIKGLQVLSKSEQQSIDGGAFTGATCPYGQSPTWYSPCSYSCESDPNLIILRDGTDPADEMDEDS